MDISPRKSLKRLSEPVDDWLHNEGYFRKHVPRDPTCLFRAFGEQIYTTQHYHIRVRRECVDFMRKNCHLFEQSISIPFESYLEQMSCFTEWGGPNEIEAMSLLYEREVFIFDGQKMIAKAATNNGFKDTVYLCHTPQKQYESVYPKDFIATAAYCQSLVYQTLYKEVFKMPNVDETVQKMLHDRTANFRHDRFFLKGNLEIREKLATELLSNIEKGGENREEEKSTPRGVTPFPYRVAKALDPNIYRNTDFDIWHELRREVRNAGWTRWNGTDLQVGGKCLVQVDYKESDLDKTNNNFAESSGDKDGNGNSSSRNSTRACVAKREPTLLYGHIQEMSKDEGPVVVFIEELGEKRTLPYGALKPIPPRRNKPNNWSPNNCRRNSTYDTNQKWKRTWNSSSRKPKDSGTSYVSKNPVDRNNNSNSENKPADDKTEDTEKLENWDDETDYQKINNGLQNYTMETYNSCQGFPVESTIDVRPVTVLLDNAPPTLRGPPPAYSSEDFPKNSPQAPKNPASNDNPDRRSPNVGSVAPEPVIQPLQQVSLQSPGEPFHPSHAAMPPLFPVNQSMLCASPDGNTYSVPFPCFTDEPPAPGSLLDRTIRAINFSAPASVDDNGSDLPFSDTVTLRFFYNLGLEYFRASHAWGYGPNGQPMNLPPNFVPQGGFLTPSDINQQAAIVNDDENSRSNSGGPRQSYVPARRRTDNPSNAGKINNPQPQQQHQHHHHQQQQQQQQMTRTYNNRKNDGQDYTNVQRNNEAVAKPIGDNHRSQTYMSNERMKEHSSVRKNGPPSKYKKNIDCRNRNVLPPNVYQPDHNYHQSGPIYQFNPGAHEPGTFQSTKSSDSSQQGNQHIWQQQQPPPPAQTPSPTGGNSQGPSYQAAYGGQPIYTAVPYYPSEGDAFYAHGPGFYPIPCVAHPEIVDGNPVNNFPPPVYPSITENYGQPISAVYPPYVYPQQTIFSGLPPQGGQENWFSITGQPQYVQYPPIQTSQAPNSSGGSPSP